MLSKLITPCFLEQMNCDRHTAWLVPKSFPSLPPPPLHIPVSPQHHSLPRILSPKGCRRAAGSWSMQDVTAGGAVPGHRAFRWEQREGCPERHSSQGSECLPPSSPDNRMARKGGQTFLPPWILSRSKRLGLASAPVA